MYHLTVGDDLAIVLHHSPSVVKRNVADRPIKFVVDEFATLVLFNCQPEGKCAGSMYFKFEEVLA